MLTSLLVHRATITALSALSEAGFKGGVQNTAGMLLPWHVLVRMLGSPPPPAPLTAAAHRPPYLAERPLNPQPPTHATHAPQQPVLAHHEHQQIPMAK